MIKLFQREDPSRGVVMLNGNLPPRAEEFASLTKQGVKLSAGKPPGKMPWLLKGEHPRWGKVEFGPMTEFTAPSPQVLGHVPDAQLSQRERALAASSRSALMVVVPAARKHALRDRKNLLGWMELLLRDADGVATDAFSQAFWSKENLADECAHDAELDVTSLFTVHAVYNDGEEDPVPYWLHTHGLGELGAFDIDILGPSRDFTDGSGDVFRALAFAAVEGNITDSTESFPMMHPGGEIRLVPAEEFDRVAPAADRELREHDGWHSKKRAVVCDPGGSRFFGLVKKGVRAASFPKTYREGRGMVLFSDTATELMSTRARQTRDVLARLIDEFAEFEFPAVVKIGYPADGGGREHMWCSVHSVSDRGIDATLENEPFNVPGVKKGDRRIHPWDTLTDWMLMSPAGQISPRNSGPARLLREKREDLRRLMKQGG